MSQLSEERKRLRELLYEADLQRMKPAVLAAREAEGEAVALILEPLDTGERSVNAGALLAVVRASLYQHWSDPSDIWTRRSIGGYELDISEAVKARVEDLCFPLSEGTANVAA